MTPLPMAQICPKEHHCLSRESQLHCRSSLITKSNGAYVYFNASSMYGLKDIVIPFNHPLAIPVYPDTLAVSDLLLYTAWCYCTHGAWQHLTTTHHPGSAALTW
jgi:hypothetical protein